MNALDETAPARSFVAAALEGDAHPRFEVRQQRRHRPPGWRCAPKTEKSTGLQGAQDELQRLKMQTAVDIRMMADDDLPAVLEIQAICYTQVTPESKESLHAKLSASRSTCLIASLAGDTVGYLIALPWEFANPPVLNAETCRLPSAPSCLYLHDLAVTPQARQFGAGRALVEAFLTRLKRTGLGRASLVAVQNSAPYWERHGFRTVAPSKSLSDKLSTYGQGVQYMERAP